MKVSINIPDDLYNDIVRVSEMNTRTMTQELLHRIKLGSMSLGTGVSMGFGRGATTEEAMDFYREAYRDDEEEGEYSEVIKRVGESLDREVSYDEKRELDELVRGSGLVWNVYKRRLEKRDGGDLVVIKQF